MDTSELLTRTYSKEFEEKDCTFKIKEILVSEGQEVVSGTELLSIIKRKVIKKKDAEYANVETSELSINFEDVNHSKITIRKWNVSEGDDIDGNVLLFLYVVEDSFGNLVYTKVGEFAKKMSDLYFSKTIPEKKLANALKAYSSDTDKERVIFLYDDTIFGSAKDGFLITDSSIVYKNNSRSFKIRFVDYIDSDIESFVEQKKNKEIERTKLIVTCRNEDDEKQIEIFDDWPSLKLDEFKVFLDFVKNLSQQGYVKEVDGYVIIEDQHDSVKLNYIKTLIIFTYLDDAQIDNEELSEIQVLMTQLNFSPELRHKVRKLITQAPDLDIKSTLSELLSESPSGSEQAISVSLLKDIIRVHNSTKETKSLESPIIQNIAKLLNINSEQLEFIEEAFQMDKKILSGEINDEQLAENAKILAGKAAAVGVPITAVYMSGSVVGLSAAGVTSGLASIGLGGVLGLSSMVTGIGVAIILGVGIYKGLQWAMGGTQREKASRREFMLQEVLRIHQKTISNLAEDANYFVIQMIDLISEVNKNELKIQKLAKQMSIFSAVIKTLKAKEGKLETDLEEESNRRATDK